MIRAVARRRRLVGGTVAVLRAPRVARPVGAAVAGVVAPSVAAAVGGTGRRLATRSLGRLVGRLPGGSLGGVVGRLVGGIVGRLVGVRGPVGGLGTGPRRGGHREACGAQRRLAVGRAQVRGCAHRVVTRRRGAGGARVRGVGVVGLDGGRGVGVAGTPGRRRRPHRP